MAKWGVLVAVLVAILPLGVDAAELVASSKASPPAKTAKVQHPRARHARGAQPFAYVPPTPTVEVQAWSDGLVDVEGFCFIPDPEFAGLGTWRNCGVY
jgi:hypothetical protein